MTDDCLNPAFGGFVAAVVPGVLTKSMRAGVLGGVVAGTFMGAAHFMLVACTLSFDLFLRVLMLHFMCCCCCCRQNDQLPAREKYLAARAAQQS